MAWVRRAAITAKVAACGLAVGGSVIVLSKAKEELQPESSTNKSESLLPNFEFGKVYASWTTDFGGTPSKKWDSNWDRKEPTLLVKPRKDKEEFEKEVEKVKPTATRHLIFIRHGQYELDGATDEERRLTELGRKQAHFTGKRLQELNLKLDTLIVSTMQRAMDTADVINEVLAIDNVQVSDLLREGAPVPPEPPIGHWKPTNQEFYSEGARIEAAFRKFVCRADASQTEDSITVVVCHANVIRYFICRALQYPPEGWLRLSLNHGSITWLTVRPNGRVSMRAMGDTGFMPAEMVTVT